MKIKPPGGKRNGRNIVGIGRDPSRTFAKGKIRGRGICLQDSNVEIDLHLVAVSPTARIREPSDHGGGLRIKGRMAHVLCPDGARRKVRRRRDDAL